MKLLNTLILVLSLSIVFTSCKKDEDETKPINEAYFKIEGGEYVNSNFPEASADLNAPSITTLYGNNSVLAGGSNPISLETSVPVSYTLVGVEGEKGYFRVPVSANKSTNYLYIVYLIIDQDLEYDTFTIVLAVLDANGFVSGHEYITVTRVEAGTGKLQISCSWDKPNDLDLHLVEPGGEEIYYSNSYSYNGGDLDVDSNAGCSIDNINNENITYGESDIVATGEYIVRIDLFSNCNVIGNTNFVVTAYYNGQLVTPTYGQNPYYGYATPESADYGGLGSGVTVLKFNVGTAKSTTEKVSLNQGFKFEYPQNKFEKPKNLSPFK